MNLIEKATVKMLLSPDGNRVFYASLLAQTIKRQTNSIPTMGVAVEDGVIVLYYNPTFLKEIMKANASFIIPILEHEMLHIVMEHPARRGSKHASLWNYAADMAVNSLIDGIFNVVFTVNGVPFTVVDPTKFGFPLKMTAEWYYNQLLKSATAVKAKLKPYTGGDHSKWKPYNNNPQLTKEVIKQAVSKALNQAKKMRGYISGDLESIINEILKPPTVDWRSLLKQYIASSIKIGHKSSWKKLNRRFHHLECVKGKISDRTITILLAIDSSGSVSDEDFKDFIAEIKGLMNIYRCKIDYVVCDAQITHTGTLKPWSKLNIKFTGRGGTDYKPVFKYFNKLSYDLLIYFTDLYCDYENCNTDKDVIWVATKDYNKDNKPPFGKLVEIKK